jgi:hypothetical protein
MKLSHGVLAGCMVVLLAGGSGFARGATCPVTNTVNVEDEFVGPFPSWKDLKRDYGAKGDGVTDDTAAIQNALNALSPATRTSNVLYIPAGTYRITATLRADRSSDSNNAMKGVSIIGEDPAITQLRWDGAAGQDLLSLDMWYSTISRLTLEGSGRARYLLYFGDTFSTYNETSDMVFRNAERGMQMGNFAGGQAENSVLRSRFENLQIGIHLNDFNSLDIWVWHSQFINNGWGIYNQAGGFNVYKSVFQGSTQGDLGHNNLNFFSVVGNTSIRSRAFFDWIDGHAWGSQVSLSGNTVLEPTGDFPIRLSNAGPYLVTDNVIKAAPGKTGAQLILGPNATHTVVGNRFTVPLATAISGSQSKSAVLDNVSVDSASIPTQAPSLPPTPPKRARPVFEVAPGGDIQEAVNLAAACSRQGTCQRPVVHLARGSYFPSGTIVVPANVNVQIIGDGAGGATAVKWVGPDNGVVFKLEGPSLASIRHLDISPANGSAPLTGVWVANADQVGGRVLANQITGGGTATYRVAREGVFTEGLANACVQVRNNHMSYTTNWVRSAGGRAAYAIGADDNSCAGGQVSVFNGGTVGVNSLLALDGGGSAILRGIYLEADGDTGFPQGVARLSGSGTGSIDAAKFAFHGSASQPVVDLNNHSGTFGIFTSQFFSLTGEMSPSRVSGDASNLKLNMEGNMWFMGGSAPFGNPPPVANVFQNTTTGANGNIAFNRNITNDSNGAGLFANTGANSPQLIRDTLLPLRGSQIWELEAVPSGVTAVRLHRVGLGVATGTGLKVTSVP